MAGPTLKLLVIEDNEADFLLAVRTLARQLPPFESRRVFTNEDLIAALQEGTWDVVITDFSVPGMDLPRTLGLISERVPGLPVILLSGSIGDEQAVSLVKKGVWDFVLKDNMVRLAPAIERGLQEAADHRARSEAETALREAEGALRTLVDAIPESVVLTDLQGTILAANETLARRFDKLTRQLVGVDFYDLLPSDVAARRRARAEECIRSREPLHFEDISFGRNIDNYMYPIKSSGEVKRLVVLGFDVTERKATEEKLREQAALLDVASDAILVRDRENRIIHWNRSAERIYGWMSDETMGKDAASLLFAPAFAAEEAAATRETLEKGEWRGDLHQKTKDGKELVVEGRWTLMSSSAGAPRGILSVNSDVTAQRSVQAQLLRSQRLESLGSLAGGIAHDLNNVLSPILMGVEGLAFDKPTDSSRKILEIIKVSAQRGAEIVRQILNFARGMEGTRGELQLKHVLREIEGIVRETFDRSISFRGDIPRDLWPVVGDPTQLHQVMLNLCVNARDAMPGGGTLTLAAANVHLDEAYARMHIEARPIRYVVLTVEDTGTGMSAGVREKIFDPFFTTKEPGKGTGLGLSTSHSIVKSHGGFINVYSEPGKGASFKVYIPAAEQRADAAAEGAPGDSVPMGVGELILVVEDEASMRDITAQILESYGYAVVTATDGTDALACYAARRDEIRLIITDMMMPYMDGAATIRALRRMNPHALIIATSGLMVGEYAREAQDLGAQAFLPKPFTAVTLLTTVGEILRNPEGA